MDDLKARTALAGYPTEPVIEAVYTPEDWRAMGMGAARRSRRRTPSSRPGRSERRTSTGASPSSCSSVPRPCPASVCRWC
ncbi:MAG: hypothetical protein R2705_06445 [Ilumatobacteraceae bacterium]